MTLLPGLSLYNQGRLSDGDFIANFVARRDELVRLLNALRLQARGGDGGHHIIAGQRGMGKSSLLRRIAIGVKEDDELRAHLLPLQFREEQYNVNTLSVFWRNCGEALAEWCETDGRAETAARLDAAVESPAWRDAETAVNAFLVTCKEIGRRPLLLVDNLDLIIDALKSEEQWALRRILQMPDGPVMVGAATHLLKQSGDREAAFYEFFHPVMLEPLSEAELMQCMRQRADQRGEAGEPVRQILAREPERLRALYGLTGGNPRVLAFVYQLLERRESSEVFADLEALLDQVSPYYKARVEEYATPQQRSVIDAIALKWDPITSHDIGAAAGIEVTTISTHLNRLKKDGFVEEVQTSGARSGYQLAERFLNIWYLMRHGTRKMRQRLLWLAKFLTKFYGVEELLRMEAEAQSEGAERRWHPDYVEAVSVARELSEATATLDAKYPVALEFNSYASFHIRGDLPSAERDLRRLLQYKEAPIGAKMGFVWLLLFTERLDEARAFHARLKSVEPVDLTILDAGLALASDNFGSAAIGLGSALAAAYGKTTFFFFDDIACFLRLAEARGYGEKLIEWFGTSGNADRYAPVHAAFVAHVRGKRFLLDVNPEVRRPARLLFDRLSAPRRNAPGAVKPDEKKPKLRGRPKRPA